MLSNKVFANWVLILLLVTIPVCSLAQEKVDPKDVNLVKKKESNNANLVKVDSTPPGVIVHFNGLYSIVGRTPFVVPYPLEGRYKIKATKPGYESETSSVNFVGNSESSIMVKLKPKSRRKAALRSLVFPGWGQFYDDDKLRGVIISAANIALIATTSLAFNEYNQSQNALDRAVKNFETAMTEENSRIVQERLAEAQDDYDFRKTMILVTASFWAYNVLDSILFFSSGRDGIQVKTSFSSSANSFGENKIELSWKIGL